MDTSTDYYVILGIDSQASAEVIKAAFKKLALQYHPDVYKGADAQERMRRLLQAYQTLSDPVARRAYDALLKGGEGEGSTSVRRSEGEGSAAARRSENGGNKVGRDKRYAFPDLSARPVTFTLGEIVYRLSYEQAETLRWDGLLEGIIREPVVMPAGTFYVCHRCFHRWSPATRKTSDAVPPACPACQARDWAEYLLLHCTRCHAVFESKEIADPLRGGSRYHPYELFPLCPHCRRSQWCPSENLRVAGLRAAAARRSMLLWGSTIIAGALLLVLVALLLLH